MWHTRRIYFILMLNEKFSYCNLNYYIKRLNLLNVLEEHIDALLLLIE